MIEHFKYLLCALLAIFHMSAALATNNTWTCTNKEIIPQNKLCDGYADCSNGRDESVKACLSNACKDDEFRCAYGACIRAELKCNNQIDCFDRSDEMELLCASDNEIWAKLQGNCTYEEFECTSDECIDDSLICDGMPDCSDGSDETVSVCASMICSDFSFRCGYGACISVQQVCDKIWDCVDGSDELCSMSVDTDTQEEPQEEKRTSTPTACTIPYENLHLQVRHRGTKQLLFYLDKILQNETVEFECSAGFELVGANHLVCVDNNWYRQWPKCVAMHRSEQCLHNRTSCDNGECIAAAALCNGVKDCTDGSDETATKCYGRNCTASEFQCKYGACISIVAVCDANQHCADGSDETLLLCTKDENDFYNILQGGCVDDEDEVFIACLSGECIPQSSICNGVPDCSDRSDETVQMCAHVKCLNTEFACAYGACVPSSAHCDGQVDCVDGSDEMRELCEYVEAERAKHEEEINFDDSYEANIDKIEATQEDRLIKAMKDNEQIMSTNAANKGIAESLPSQPIHMGVAYRRCTIPVDRVALRAVLAEQNATLKVGSQVDIGKIVTFSCEETWQLVEGEAELLCMPLGEWSSIVPKCEKRCPPQWSGISTTTTCTYNDKATDCGVHSKPGTKAVVQCGQGYEAIMQRVNLHCGVDGEWDAPRFKCQAKCTLPASNLFNEKNEMLVNIFKLSENEKEALNPIFKLECKGTIISPKLVLTSALCFSYINLSYIAAANDPVMYRILPASTQIDSFNQYEQLSYSHNISQIIIADDFTTDDLDPPAIVVLVDYFAPNIATPICMEFSRSCLNRENGMEDPAEILANKKGVAFSSNGCFAVVGQSELIFIDKYKQWLEMHILSYKYLL